LDRRSDYRPVYRGSKRFHQGRSRQCGQILRRYGHGGCVSQSRLRRVT
jgi:hypothetical protein